METLDTAFSSLDLIGHCMADVERSEAFDRAIRAVVRPHHTVLDAGTGSGLLAMFAARAGALRVVALEFDPFIAGIARENIRQNGYAEVIEVIEADARNWPPPTHFDVVVMEMLTTGMVDEFQIQAVNNLHRQGAVNATTVFVPQRQETHAALARTQFDAYGLRMRMVRHLWKELLPIEKFELLSEPRVVNAIAFDRQHDEQFECDLEFDVQTDGRINSLYLASRTVLAAELSVMDTLSLNAPVVIPMAERDVQAGERIALRIAYRFGHGYGQFRADFV